MTQKIHTDGYGDCVIDPAQSAESVKMYARGASLSQLKFLLKAFWFLKVETMKLD